MKKVFTKTTDSNKTHIFTAIHFAFCLLALVGVVFLFFSPLCIIEASPTVKYTATALNGFEFLNSPLQELSSAAPLLLACLFIAAFALLLCIARTAMALLSYKNEKRVAKYSKKTVYNACIVILAYTVIEYLFAPFNIMISGYTSTAQPNLFPPIFIIVVTLAFSVFIGITGNLFTRPASNDSEEILDLKNKIKRFRRAIFYKHLELVIFAWCLSLLLWALCFPTLSQ